MAGPDINEVRWVKPARGINRDARLVGAFEKGATANKRGKPLAACPHPPSNEEFYQAWNAGWWWEEGPAYRIRICRGRIA